MNQGHLDNQSEDAHRQEQHSQLENTSDTLQVGINKITLTGDSGSTFQDGYYVKEMNHLQKTYLLKGNYKSGFRQGLWRYYSEDGEVVCKGHYEQGKQVGRWTEFNKHHSNVFEQGLYSAEGFRTGYWFIHDRDLNNYKIGGGLYAEGKKFGIWVEPIEINCNQFDRGLYNNKGERDGKWTIFEISEAQSIKIGGGLYQNNVKIGNWTEITSYRYQESGLYNNGLKEGLWITIPQSGKEEKEIKQNEFTLKGEYKNGIKVGQWTEPNHEFREYDKGFYNEFGKRDGLWESTNKQKGHYKNGLKVGLWTQYNPEYEDCYYETGNYNEEGIKVGHWIIHKAIHQDIVVGGGEYINGFKVGQWSESMKYNNDYFQSGKYSDKGQRDGEWIAFTKSSKDQKQMITGKGQYRNGIKVGQWDEMKVTNRFILKISGIYDDYGKKQGEWQTEDLHPNFQEYKIRMKGSYINGHRVGNWFITRSCDRQCSFSEYSQKGELNGQCKIVSKYEQTKIFSIGQYQEGEKIGQWLEPSVFNTEYYDQGSYSDQSERQGQWITLHEGEQMGVGNYRQGRQIGKWVEADQTSRGIQHTGFYDDNGNKTGKWITYYTWDCTIILMEGNYENGLKIGQWVNTYDDEFQYFESGTYIANEVKHGVWIFGKQDNQDMILGKGEYDHGVKIGQWLEKRSEFSDQYISGVYINGIKEGYWQYLLQEEGETEILGGGKYLNGIRVGEWRKPRCRFNKYLNCGTYDEQGQKVGQWQLLKKRRGQTEYTPYVPKNE